MNIAPRRPFHPREKLAALLARRWLLLLWLLAGLLIALQIAPRLGEGSWENQILDDHVLFNGVPIHWEWIDVAQSALLAEGDKRWHDRGSGFLLSQNASRLLPGPVISLLTLWTRDLWRAAVVATWLCWLIAVGAMYALCRALIADPARGRTTGIIAAGLVVFSPGFTAFVNNIEAQPFGYAAVVVALLALHRSPVFGRHAPRAAASTDCPPPPLDIIKNDHHTTLPLAHYATTCSPSR